MKLLVITQKLDKNDDLLGFFHEWVKEFAKNVDQLSVIALGVGEYDLPENINVHSLGKENGTSKISRIIKFYSLVFSKRNEYDAVFVHMNPEYIILAGLFWRRMKKKVFLWYTHKHVSLRLKMGHAFCTKVFSASKESFRLPTNKLHVMGHGIATSVLIAADHKEPAPFTVLTIGRISPVKRHEDLIEAMGKVKKQIPDVVCKIVGAPGTSEQIIYMQKLEAHVRNKCLEKNVVFVGSIPNRQILPYLQKADVFVNLSGTGSVDKAVLEAMSAEVPILTSNEAFFPILKNMPNLIVSNEPAALSQSILKIHAMKDEEKKRIGKELREMVVKDHNLQTLIGRLVALMRE